MYFKTRFPALLPSLSTLAVLAFFSGPVNAALIMASEFNENDCAGFFGSSFDSCQIISSSDGGDTIEISPVIATFDSENVLSDSGVDEINSIYPSITGDEWTFSNNTTNSEGELLSGDWSYVAGTDDPGIRYWAAKGGTDFKLFWEVPDSAVNDGICDTSTAQSAFTLECLAEALVVTSGSWETPSRQALSHLTFYDSEPPELVPEPVTLALIGLGLVGLGVVRRKRIN